MKIKVLVAIADGIMDTSGDRLSRNGIVLSLTDDGKLPIRLEGRDDVRAAIAMGDPSWEGDHLYVTFEDFKKSNPWTAYWRHLCPSIFGTTLSRLGSLITACQINSINLSTTGNCDHRIRSIAEQMGVFGVDTMPDDSMFKDSKDSALANFLPPPKLSAKDRQYLDDMSSMPYVDQFWDTASSAGPEPKYAAGYIRELVDTYKKMTQGTLMTRDDVKRALYDVTGPKSRAELEERLPAGINLADIEAEILADECLNLVHDRMKTWRAGSEYPHYEQDKEFGNMLEKNVKAILEAFSVPDFVKAEAVEVPDFYSGVERKCEGKTEWRSPAFHVDHIGSFKPGPNAARRIGTGLLGGSTAKADTSDPYLPSTPMPKAPINTPLVVSPAVFKTLIESGNYNAAPSELTQGGCGLAGGAWTGDSKTVPDKCECGAHKSSGAARGKPGHSSWCPWSYEDLTK